jgi:hypothetical protein
MEACEGLGPAWGARTAIPIAVRSGSAELLGRPIAEYFGREPAWLPLPSRPPGMPPPRMPASAELRLSEWPLSGRPIGLPVPAGRPVHGAPSEWAPSARMAASPYSGWETPFWPSVDSKRAPVRWGRVESSAPVPAKPSNGRRRPSGIALLDEVLLNGPGLSDEARLSR